MYESTVLKLARIMATKLGFTMFRNNVGVAKLPNGNVVRYGLCKGSSDLIGFKSIEITQDMVGKKVAVFTAIECKREGGIYSTEQINFLNYISLHGGIVVKFSTPLDLEEQYGKWKNS
jgi:hypothetical protein